MVKLVVTALTFLAITPLALAQEVKPSVDIRTEYLMTIEAKLGSRVPVGQRVIVNVLGGTVRGPRLKGEIVAPAGDWVFVMPDGSGRLDVRFTIKTDDGEFVFVEYSGISAPTKEAQERLAKGEAVTAADGYGYFTTTPRFMTTSAKYAWSNEIQGVARWYRYNAVSRLSMTSSLFDKALWPNRCVSGNRRVSAVRYCEVRFSAYCRLLGSEILLCPSIEKNHGEGWL